MPAFFVFKPGAVTIEWERRPYFPFLHTSQRLPGLTCGRVFAGNRPKIVQIRQTFPILLTV
jgi:hypothetical protein